MANIIVTLGLIMLVVVCAWFNITTGTILCSVVLGFYLCLVADAQFTDRLKEDKQNETPDHYA